MAYRNATGGRDTFFNNFYLYAYTIPLDPTRTIQSITLPNNSNIKILAMDLI